jgi:DNA-binding response OmpR family regulator
MLPGIPGDEICRLLRQDGDWTPIIMLTAREAVADQVDAFDSGADDYLTKPFSFAILLARLRALIRRGGRPRPAVLRVGGLALDPATRSVSRDGAIIDLTTREFSVLEYLMRRSGEVVSKHDIIEGVWDFGFDGDPNIVEVYISHLRNRIDRPFDRDTLRTVRGAGYRLADDHA